MVVHPIAHSEKRNPREIKYAWSLRWDEGRRSDFGRSVAEFIELPHYWSVVKSFEK